MKFKIWNIVAGIVSVSMLICSASAATVFPDVDEDAPYADAAEYLSEIGVMQGDAQGNFNPDKTVTRAQMAAIICRMLGETENLAVDGGRFTDVQEAYWANRYIVKAAELGIISGYQNGSFKPENTVTYEQAVTMIVRVMNLEESALAAGGYPSGYVSVAEEYGFTHQLLTQSGDLMTRGQIAILVYNTRV